MRRRLALGLIGLLSLACQRLSGEVDGEHHGNEHGDHHEEGHDGSATSFTSFSGDTELFIELPSLVVGRAVEPAAHVTRLADFRPLEGGRLRVELAGGGKPPEAFEAEAPAMPGIFRPVVKPLHAARRDVTVVVTGEDLDVRHALGSVVVYPSGQAAAEGAGDEPDEQGGISFLKEQQWRMDFATEVVKARPIRPSFDAYGTIRPRAGGQAHVTPPVAGRLRAGDTFPRVGDRVEQNDLLASMTPRLTDQSDMFAIRQNHEQARIALERAEHERKRLESLLDDGAVPEDSVIDARFNEEQARAAFQATRQRLAQARSLQGAGGGGGGFELRAPMSGTVVSVNVAPGAFVEQNEHVFGIVDLERLWLEVHVAETHVPLLTAPQGVWFVIEGFDEPFEASKEQVVTVGGVLDRASRTVPLFVEVDNSDGHLRVGMFADVHVLTGEPREALAVPVSAVLHEAGLPTVYVQLGGETFERRALRIGQRDGGFVEVLEGLKAGERVVGQGAYAVRLAAASGQIPEHGHHH